MYSNLSPTIFSPSVLVLATPLAAQVSISDGDLSVNGLATIADDESANSGLSAGEGGASLDNLMYADGEGASSTDADNFAFANARSPTVMNELLLEHDIEPRLLTGGKDESEPIASNETADGRSLNRRITFIRN